MKVYSMLLLTLVGLVFAGCKKEDSTAPATTTTETNAPSTNAPAPAP